MVIELPFAYTANYLPTRARNVREVTVLDTLPLTIRELSDEEFPVAARYASAFMELRGWQPDDLRWDGRRFHRPFACEWAGWRFYVPASEFLGRIQGHEGEQPFRDLQKVPDPRWHNKDVLRHADVIAAGRVESDDRRERIAQLVEKAAGVVLCDGRIFEACGVPAWRISQSGIIDAEAVLADSAMVASQPHLLARADRLQEYAQQFWGRDDMSRSGRIEVLMPQALSLAPEAGHLLIAAATAVAKMGDRLKQASREDFSVYADLRDALADGPAGEITEDIAAAVRTAVDWEGVVIAEDVRRDLCGAYERWRKNMIRDTGPDLPSLTTAIIAGL